MFHDNNSKKIKNGWNDDEDDWYNISASSSSSSSSSSPSRWTTWKRFFVDEQYKNLSSKKMIL